MFEQIVLVDNTGLHQRALDDLQSLSQNTIINYTTDPTSDEETQNRIQNADAVFVSWRTPIGAKILESCPKIKYIGMCCSLYDPDSANVDVRYAQTKQITVKGIKDYGDEGVIEFIISETIQLLKGLGGSQWKPEVEELGQQKVGIIGMGATGKMLARAFRYFGADVYYFSRTPKPELEKEGIRYLNLKELLQNTDIISTHLPKHSNMLGNVEFELIGSGKILINTSLGLTFDKDAFDTWISNQTNFAIFDGEGIKPHYDEYNKCSNVIIKNTTTGWTKEAKVRLSKKVIENVQSYLTQNRS